MNPFSGSTNLWRHLGEYEPFNILCWQCKGLLSGSYGPKICQNMTFWALSNIFASKKIEMNPFPGSTNSWRLLREYEPF